MRKTNEILGDECVTLYGSDTISDTLGGLKFDISPLSFYQVNRNGAERLYSLAGEFAALTGGETLLDLYCGAGTIGLFLSGKVKKLYGAEIIPQAVENARENAAKNGIENAEFFCADAGEAALTDMMGRPFHHNEQSLRVVDQLERDGRGLNLTYEVRMGILGHTGTFIPETWEGQIVRVSDRIAYINHDIDDAMRAGILTEDDIPRDIALVLGGSHSARINTLVENMIYHTQESGVLGMEPEVAGAMDQLRTFMFQHVYTNPVAKGEESKAKDIIRRLFEYYSKHPDKLPADFIPQLDFDGMERIVCDYIAGMTDKYAIYKYSEIFIPTAWQVR